MILSSAWGPPESYSRVRRSELFYCTRMQSKLLWAKNFISIRVKKKLLAPYAVHIPVYLHVQSVDIESELNDFSAKAET